MGSPATAIEIRDRAEFSQPAYLLLQLFSCGHFFIDMYSIALGTVLMLSVLRLEPAGSTHRVSSPFRKFVVAVNHSPDRKGGGPLADAWGFQHSKLPK
jgi:hypothetical protein